MVVWGRVFVGCFLFVFVCFVCFSFCFRLFVFVPPIKWSLIGVEGCVREGSNHRWESLASVKRGEFDERGGCGEWASCGEL